MPTAQDTSPTSIEAPHDGAAVGDDALQWLSHWSRVAASAPNGSAFARQSAGALAGLLGMTHYAVAEMDEEGDRLSIDLRRSGAEHVDYGLGPIEVSAADTDSLISVAIRSDRLLCVERLDEFETCDRDLANLNLSSAAVMPLVSQRRIHGAIMLANLQPRRLEPRERSLLEALGSITSATIARSDAQCRLKQQTSVTRAIQDSIHAAMIVLSPEGKITQVNPACCQITGFEPVELIDRTLWSALLIEEELDPVQFTLARVRNSDVIERFDSYILTKGGVRRRISWSASRLHSDVAAQAGIVCTGIDITDRCEAVERASRAEAAAIAARQMFAQLQRHIKTGQKQLDDSGMAQHLPEGVEYDRRARPRREYPYVQLIAPLHDRCAPDEHDFRELKCHDISSRGFAFLANAKPDHERVIVAFGAPPSVVYLTADIRHATLKPETDPPEYVVGCRYTGRFKA